MGKSGKTNSCGLTPSKKGPKRKIDLIKLQKLLNEGKTQSEIAKIFKVSGAAVCKAIQKSDDVANKHIAINAAPEIVKRRMDLVDEFMANYDDIRAVVDEAKGSDDLELQRKALESCAKFLRLAMDMERHLFDARAVETFQETLVEVLEEMGEEYKQVFIEKLHKKRMLAKALGSKR